MSMNSRSILLLAAGVAMAFAAHVAAASFSSGSTGTYGDIVVPNSTTIELDVPPDGIFNCGKITVGSGGRLRLKPNPLNTAVYFLCTGDVLITGVLDLNAVDASGATPGRGGPGGFDGGFAGGGDRAPLSLGGDGHGPGGGRNSAGAYPAAYSAVSGSNDKTYGNVLIVPMIGGSGGSGVNGNPGYAGGGGGGAVLIASDTQIVVNGRIEAIGGSSVYGGGSGGAIRLVSPTGGGTGSLNTSGASGGSSGRIRIDCENPLAFRNLSLNGLSTRGTRLFVFPPTIPTLHIIQVAGNNIAPNAAAGVSFELPAGSPTSQTVRLRGVGFTQTVPIRLMVTPEHTPSTVYDLNLNGTANPAEAETQVTLPVGELVRIEAWAR